EIRPDRIAELLDLSVEEAIQEGMSAGAFFPSLTGEDQWELGSAFLSGDVRAKLDHANELAAAEPSLFGPAADALAEVVPDDVDPSTISARPGAAWIPHDVYRAFLADEFGVDPGAVTIEHSREFANWTFRVRGGLDADPYAVADTDWDGLDLFQAIANNRPISSHKTEEELEISPRPRIHTGRTELLHAAAAQITDRFSSWL